MINKNEREDSPDEKPPGITAIKIDKKATPTQQAKPRPISEGSPEAPITGNSILDYSEF